MRRRHALRAIACCAAFVAAATPPLLAEATNVTANLQVTATVVSACIMSGGTLAFGSSIDPTATATPVNASATFTVDCTATTPYTIAMSAGANAGGASNFSARALKSGSNTLGYQLYSDSGRTVVWGDGTNTSSTKAGTGIGSNQTLTVYGSIPSLSGAVPGAYTDTVTITVTY